MEVSSEHIVLGSVIIDRDCVHDVIGIVNSRMFHDPFNAKVMQAIEYLYSQSEPIDIVSVAQRMMRQGDKGSAYQLTQITNSVGGSANAPYHARIVAESWMKRELFRIGHTIANASQDTGKDVFDVLERGQSELEGILSRIDTGGARSIGDVAIDVAKELMEAKSRPGGVSGITTGYREIDQMIGGLKEPDLIIVAARPAMGKTSLVTNIAMNCGEPVGLFSLEMSNEQVAKRIISGKMGVPVNDLNSGRFGDQSLQEAVDKVCGHKIEISDKAAINVLEFKTTARRMIQEHGVKVLAIDYIQLMTDNSVRGANREQQVSNISRGLKAVAKDLKVPVIALSQLSRSCESRSDKRPMLSDLRESGAIEQDADVVMFLYRPAYYGEEVDEFGEPFKQGLTEIIISKNRNGSTGTINLEFHGSTTEFKSMDYSGGDFRSDERF